ncbi:MAG: hypothetical protein KGM16_17910 [Bacteroidota bacterium]|nr:hypothetical protein [Bacteroidota bacterium]
MPNKDTSKGWFELGDYPTQAQFAQVFEWLRWKDETIGIGDVTGLQTIVNNLPSKLQEIGVFDIVSAGSFALEANKLVITILLKSDTDQTVQIGSTDGGNELAIDVPVTAGKTTVLDLKIWGEDVPVVYFSGFAGNVHFKLIKNIF